MVFSGWAGSRGQTSLDAAANLVLADTPRSKGQTVEGSDEQWWSGLDSRSVSCYAPGTIRNMLGRQPYLR